MNAYLPTHLNDNRIMEITKWFRAIAATTAVTNNDTNKWEVRERKRR